MKALVFEKPDAPAVRDVPMPEIDENGVLLRMKAVGICHSDYELLAGRYIIPISYPVTPGHEWCGEVVETGRNVTNLRRGDRVVGECVVKLPDRIHHFGFSLDGADREYVTDAYYAHPTAWNEIGFGGPASPRGYVRLDKNRRDPWEAAEGKPGQEERAARENRNVV